MLAGFFSKRPSSTKPDRILQAPVDKIFQNPYQPRRIFPRREMEQLVKSIRQFGVLMPIMVRECRQGYELACGERRLRACREVGLKTIPAIVRDLTTPQMVELALIENLVRNDLAILEEADAFDRLKREFAVVSDTELADRLGVPRERVERYVRLARLPMLVKKALQEGHIAEDHALILGTIENPAELRKWMADTIKQKLTVEGLTQGLSRTC